MSHPNAEPQWIGKHTRVKEKTCFRADDPNDEPVPVEVFFCETCGACEETRHELVNEHPTCQAAA